MQVDPAYAQIAVRKFGQRILREQVNLDLVSEEAARQLKDAQHSPPGAQVSEIDDDWLNHFEKEASQRSSEDMQKLFGRILAGEIRRPSSFSIKALKIMGEIDRGTATLFKRLCSACVALRVPQLGQIIDARVPSLGGNAASNALQKYGFSFGQLNILQEHGLLISDYNSYMGYEMCIADKDLRVPLGFCYQNSDWGLVPTEDRPPNATFRVHGVALSQAGRELLKIVETEPIDNYTNDLRNFFEKEKLRMIPMSHTPKT